MPINDETAQRLTLPTKTSSLSFVMTKHITVTECTAGKQAWANTCGVSAWDSGTSLRGGGREELRWPRRPPDVCPANANRSRGWRGAHRPPAAPPVRTALCASLLQSRGDTSEQEKYKGPSRIRKDTGFLSEKKQHLKPHAMTFSPTRVTRIIKFGHILCEGEKDLFHTLLMEE